MCSPPKSYRPGSGRARINTSPVKKLAYLSDYLQRAIAGRSKCCYPIGASCRHEAKVLKAEADPAGNCIRIIAIAA